MERREAIKNIGLTFGTVVASPGILTLLKSCGPTEAPWVPVFFTEEEGIVIRKLVDAILPAVDELPSATEVNTHVFIDRYINEVMEFEDRKSNRGSLGVLIKRLLADSGKEKVKGLETADYESFLETNLKKTKEETDEIYGIMRENEGDPSGLPDDVRIFPFLEGLRGLAIWGYKSSEQVGETILAYASVPGEQKGCVDLQETTGGKAWAL